MTRRILLFLLALGSLCAEDTWKGVARIVAVGDVHGGYTKFVELLRAANVIDEKDRWVGGKTHLVQVGDVVDRGPDSRKAMDLLMALEKQAQKAGGRVHCLIGNHEAMNLYGDLRYTSAAEYAAFRTGESEAQRDALWRQESEKMNPRPDEAAKEKWMAEHPAGWVEHRVAFGPQGKYGKWIRDHNAVIKINDSLFLHGGISPKYLTKSLKDLNNGVEEELRDFSKLTKEGFVMDSAGPLWYRGLAKEDPALGEHVKKALAHFGVKRIVVGHTPTGGKLVSLYGGAVMAIDAGISDVYGGHKVALVIEGDKTFRLTPEQTTPLP